MKKLLLITTALVAAAGPAHAGPVAAIAAWVGTTLAGGGLAAFALNTALSMGLSAIASALYKPKGQGASVNFDVQMGDDLPLRFVVGDYATAGQRKYLGSWGRNTRFITEVIEVSALPQGFGGIWVNDERGELVPGVRGYVWAALSPDRIGQYELLEGSSLPSGALDIGQAFSNHKGDRAVNRIHVKWVDGTQAAADPFLLWAFGNDPDYPWTANHIGRGKTYAIVTTRYDSEHLTSYPAYLFEPAPLPMYDLRYDSTNGGSGPQRWNDRATWQPSRNPAVIAYNITRGIHYGSEWVFGGKNLPAWRLPQAEWIAAANACDAPKPRAGGGTEPAYRCGLEITVDTEPARVLEEIGKAANMKFAEVGGRLKPIVDLPGAAALSFTDGDILITEGQSFRPFYPVSDTFNAISATYPEPGEKWSSKDAPIYIDAEATAADDGRYLPTSMDYPAVPYARQVQRLMRSQMRDFRRMRQHQFSLPPDAYGLEPGIDLVSWTSERNGYVNKLFMVERTAKVAGMNVPVTLREIDPSDYDWSSDFEQPIVITPPKNPVPFVQPINGLTVTGAIIRDAASNARRAAILVTCDGDEVGVTHIQIEARVSGRSEISIDTLRRFSAPFAWYLQNVIPGTSYEVRARLLSEVTPRSVWSGWITVTTPSVTLSWDDLTGEVRDSVEELEEWAGGTSGLIRDVRDEIGSITDGLLEVDLGAYTQRETLRRTITAEVGAARSQFDERIAVAVSDTEAVAVRTEVLRAELGGVSAAVRQESIARARQNEALAADIRSVEAGIDDAVAEATSGLVARVEDTEEGLVAQADSIDQVQARTDRGTATGLLRVSAESGPAGVQSRIGLRAEATADGSSHSSAMYLEAKSDGTSQAGFVADRFWIATGTGVNAGKFVPFIVDGNVVYIDTALIKDGTIDNAKIGNIIQSLGFISGPTGQGWRINKDGSAEFNDVTIRRQIEVASGSLNVGPFTPETIHPAKNHEGSAVFRVGRDVNLQNGPGLVRTVLTTPIPISEWQGTRQTYIATAGMVGTVSSTDTDSCYWGWTAEVLPLTKWSGNQSLRLRLLFWCQEVTLVQNCVVTWKIYRVS